MSNQEVADIAFENYEKGTAEEAANNIVRNANLRWRQRSEVIDDITIVVIFLLKNSILLNMHLGCGRDNFDITKMAQFKAT